MFSNAVRLIDLDDFLQPSQLCVKPTQFLSSEPSFESKAPQWTKHSLQSNKPNVSQLSVEESARTGNRGNRETASFAKAAPPPRPNLIKLRDKSKRIHARDVNAAHTADEDIRLNRGSNDISQNSLNFNAPGALTFSPNGEKVENNVANQFLASSRNNNAKSKKDINTSSGVSADVKGVIPSIYCTNNETTTSLNTSIAAPTLTSIENECSPLPSASTPLDISNIFSASKIDGVGSFATTNQADNSQHPSKASRNTIEDSSSSHVSVRTADNAATRDISIPSLKGKKKKEVFAGDGENFSTKDVGGNNAGVSNSTMVAEVSLFDCLACNGCVTSAETVFLQQQSILEFLRSVASKPLSVVSVSPQSRTALSKYYNINASTVMRKLASFFKCLGVSYVVDTSMSEAITLLEAQHEFVCRYLEECEATVLQHRSNEEGNTKKDHKKEMVGSRLFSEKDFKGSIKCKNDLTFARSDLSTLQSNIADVAKASKKVAYTEETDSRPKRDADRLNDASSSRRRLEVNMGSGSIGADKVLVGKQVRNPPGNCDTNSGFLNGSLCICEPETIVDSVGNVNPKVNKKSSIYGEDEVCKDNFTSVAYESNDSSHVSGLPLQISNGVYLNSVKGTMTMDNCTIYSSDEDQATSSLSSPESLITSKFSSNTFPLSCGVNEEHYLVVEGDGNDVGMNTMFEATKTKSLDTMNKNVDSLEPSFPFVNSTESSKEDITNSTKKMMNTATKNESSFQAKKEQPKLPIITSHCPGWIVYAEKTLDASNIDLISHVRSSQQIQGILVKSLLRKEFNRCRILRFYRQSFDLKNFCHQLAWNVLPPQPALARFGRLDDKSGMLLSDIFDETQLDYSIKTLDEVVGNILTNVVPSIFSTYELANIEDMSKLLKGEKKKEDFFSHGLKEAKIGPLHSNFVDDSSNNNLSIEDSSSVYQSKRAKKISSATTQIAPAVCYDDFEFQSSVKLVEFSRLRNNLQNFLSSRYVKPSDTYHVCIMPCYDKKLEASRPEYSYSFPKYQTLTPNVADFDKESEKLRDDNMFYDEEDSLKKKEKKKKVIQTENEDDPPLKNKQGDKIASTSTLSDKKIPEITVERLYDEEQKEKDETLSSSKKKPEDDSNSFSTEVIRDVDTVLSTSELLDLFSLFNIDFTKLGEQDFDTFYSPGILSLLRSSSIKQREGKENTMKKDTIFTEEKRNISEVKEEDHRHKQCVSLVDSKLNSTNTLKTVSSAVDNNINNDEFLYTNRLHCEENLSHHQKEKSAFLDHQNPFFEISVDKCNSSICYDPLVEMNYSHHTSSPPLNGKLSGDNSLSFYDKLKKKKIFSNEKNHKSSYNPIEISENSKNSFLKDSIISSSCNSVRDWSAEDLIKKEDYVNKFSTFEYYGEYFQCLAEAYRNGRLPRVSKSHGGSGGFLEAVFCYAARELFGVIIEMPLQFKKGKNDDYKEIFLEVDGVIVLHFVAAYGFRNITNVVKRLKSVSKPAKNIEKDSTVLNISSSEAIKASNQKSLKQQSYADISGIENFSSVVASLPSGVINNTSESIVSENKIMQRSKKNGDDNENIAPNNLSSKKMESASFVASNLWQDYPLRHIVPNAIHFVELMACPGGCLAGAGQNFATSPDEKLPSQAQDHASNSSSSPHTNSKTDGDLDNKQYDKSPRKGRNFTDSTPDEVDSSKINSNRQSPIPAQPHTSSAEYPSNKSANSSSPEKGHDERLETSRRGQPTRVQSRLQRQKLALEKMEMLCHDSEETLYIPPEEFPLLDHVYSFLKKGENDSHLNPVVKEFRNSVSFVNSPDVCVPVYDFSDVEQSGVYSNKNQRPTLASAVCSSPGVYKKVTEPNTTSSSSVTNFPISQVNAKWEPEPSRLIRGISRTSNSSDDSGNNNNNSVYKSSIHRKSSSPPITFTGLSVSNFLDTSVSSQGVSNRLMTTSSSPESTTAFSSSANICSSANKPCSHTTLNNTTNPPYTPSKPFASVGSLACLVTEFKSLKKVSVDGGNALHSSLKW